MTGAHGGPRWTDELLDKKRQRGDHLADDAVEELLKRGNIQAVNDLMQTLVSNDQPESKDLPVEIQKYLAATPTVLPNWADPVKIKRGQELFEGLGLEISLCLFCASLPSA